MSTFNGHFWSETKDASNWNYGWSTFYMHGGADKVITPHNGNVAYTFHGDGGNDWFRGNDGNDYGYGGDDQDLLEGQGGRDYLEGNGGSDLLYGGYDRDILRGGTDNDYLSGGVDNDKLNGGSGVDRLSGGEGRDQFVFKQGDSNISSADTVTDWSGAFDLIDSTVAGTAGNYGEGSTYAVTIQQAVYQAEHSNLSSETHVFLYNAGEDRGFLLSDLDHNGHFETGVNLTGAGSASDMSFYNIIYATDIL